jgi:hypothetical protein
MRTLVVSLFAPLVAYAACTPDIVSGSYVCGPERSCPEGQSCNGVRDVEAGLEAETCVLGSLARPFACKPEINSEPDDTPQQAYQIQNTKCVSTPLSGDGCMLEGDTADWLWFQAPAATDCAAVEVQIRLTFPVAYEQLGVELWDLDHNMQVATDSDCKSTFDDGATRRCLNSTLVLGTKYGIKVAPNGSGACDGDCAYNRYTLNVQLATPS